LKFDRTYPNIQNTDRPCINKTDRLTTNLYVTKARLKMNITRVERDGVEFFTIDETGESGMSESGLARLCGVNRVSVNKLIRTSLLAWEQEKSIDLNRGVNFRCKPSKESSPGRGQNKDITFVRAKVCARVIEHYAFESKYKTDEALFTYRKFASMGIASWIQEITHWHGNPKPRTGIVLEFATIAEILDKKIDGTALRIFLVLQKALRDRVILTPAEIMQRVDISQTAYRNAIARLADANLLPEWITIKRRSHPERDVRDRLQAQLGGKVEAYTKFGLIDLLTETELIEIKIAHRWKDAIGHILAKSYKYPNHKKRLHLFGPEEPIMETIENACNPWDISVSFEKVDRPKIKQTSQTKSIEA
jgi:hypothetical protein